MKFVRNRTTGITHTVPDDHWSLTDSEYEIVQAPRKPKEPRKRAPKPEKKVWPIEN